MAAQAPGELVCDMAETYHVLDWRALGLPLAATLAGGLRETSRTQMALSHAPITTDTLLLGAMADSLQLLVWSKTKDAQHGRNRPAPVLDTLLGTARRKVTGFATAAEFEAAKAEILKGVLQIKVNRFFRKNRKKYSADSRVKMRIANRTPSKIGGSQMT